MFLPHSATVVVAPTAFKGTLSPLGAARAIARGWRRARPRDRLVLLAMADGGDGTAEVLKARLGGRWLRRTVRDPIGRRVRASALVLPDGTAVVEMARASGLVLVDAADRDPLHSDTRGTGELVLACLERGAERVLLGVGGSATTDGGAGFAHALGVRFLDVRGLELDPCPDGLLRVATVDRSGLVPGADRVEALADVSNPLLGPRGAAAVYGPQKGATPEDVRLLTRALARLREASGGAAAAAMPGAGAAGGLGFGVVALAGGCLVAGGERVARALGLAGALDAADLAVTGEGRLDSQTLEGKAPAVVAGLAAIAGVPCVAVAGTCTLPPRALRLVGIDDVEEASGGTVEAAARSLAARIGT